MSALSGSGLAFVFQFIEALSDGGVHAGLPRHLATKLASQTVLGAAKMVIETERHPAELRDTVTSPGGVTIEGVRTAEKYGLRVAAIEAVLATQDKLSKMNV